MVKLCVLLGMVLYSNIVEWVAFSSQPTDVLAIYEFPFVLHILPETGIITRKLLIPVFDEINYQRD